jgi:hypothetical protein
VFLTIAITVVLTQWALPSISRLNKCKLPRLRQVPVRFTLFLITVEMVEGAEMREIDILGLYTSNVAIPLQSLSTGQDINDQAHPVVSQDEGVISI